MSKNIESDFSLTFYKIHLLSLTVNLLIASPGTHVRFSTYMIFPEELLKDDGCNTMVQTEQVRKQQGKLLDKIR